MRKDVGAETTLFVYDEAGNLLGEYDAMGVPIREHVWFNGAPVAVLDGTNTYYVHTDHLGTPRAISDGTTEIWRWLSTPFGTNVADEDPDGDLTQFTYNLRFPGQYYDSETGLHYNYFRTYDPSTGRYLESDPIGLWGGLNMYGYVAGSPLSKIDPLGLVEWDVELSLYTSPLKIPFTRLRLPSSRSLTLELTSECIDGYQTTISFRTTDIKATGIRNPLYAVSADFVYEDGLDEVVPLYLNQMPINVKVLGAVRNRVEVLVGDESDSLLETKIIDYGIAAYGNIEMTGRLERSRRARVERCECEE